MTRKWPEHCLATILGLAVTVMFIPRPWINPTLFQAGLFLLAGACVIVQMIRPRELRISFPMIPLACTVVWGVVQLAANSTADPADTRSAVLLWAGNLVAFCLAIQMRQRLLDTLLYFAFALSIVSVVLYFRGGDPPTLGPFVSRDQYAAFIELTLPLALVRALGGGRASTGYAVVSAAMYASVVAGASRAGAVLVTAEIVIVPVLMRINLLSRNSQGEFSEPHTPEPKKPSSTRNPSGRAATIYIAGMALVFVTVVGWAVLWNRFQDPDPFGGRREILSDTIAMIHARPWMGFGLGAFRTTYPAYASMDFGAVVHHAHNDWAEWAADGGIPFALLMLSIAVWSFPRAVRSVWGIGIVAVFVHALVDFPLQKPVLDLWLFTLLGVLATADPN